MRDSSGRRMCELQATRECKNFIDRQIKANPHLTPMEAMSADFNTRCDWTEFVNSKRGNLTDAIWHNFNFALEHWNAAPPQPAPKRQVTEQAPLRNRRLQRSRGRCPPTPRSSPRSQLISQRTNGRPRETGRRFASSFKSAAAAKPSVHVTSYMRARSKLAPLGTTERRSAPRSKRMTTLRCFCSQGTTGCRASGLCTALFNCFSFKNDAPSWRPSGDCWVSN